MPAICLFDIIFGKFHSVWGLSAVVGKKYATSATHLKAPASQNFPRKETKRRTDRKKGKIDQKDKKMYMNGSISGR